MTQDIEPAVGAEQAIAVCPDPPARPSDLCDGIDVHPGESGDLLYLVAVEAQQTVVGGDQEYPVIVKGGTDEPAFCGLFLDVEAIVGIIVPQSLVG